ncbi:MAG TPA: GGDEF domain-containing protein [Longimicrobiales bacterium]
MPGKPYPGPPVARQFGVERATGAPERPIHRLTQYLEHAQPVVLWGIAAALIAIAAATDIVTGPNVDWSFFYLPAVVLLAWFRSWPAARFAALASALAGLAVQTYDPTSIEAWNALGHAAIFLFVGFILAQLRSALREEHQMARTDDLTGVANSRSFLEFATLEMARQRRYGHPLSLVFLDCDNFKRVNDFYGHAKGDELLRRVALTITQTLREVDFVARFGGDEFAMLLPESDQRAAAAVVRKLRNTLRLVGDQYNVSFSMGIVTFLQPADSIEQMLNAADKIMYDVKRTGKNAAKHRVYGRTDVTDDEQGVLPGI